MAEHDHEHDHDDLVSYLLDELSADERGAFEAHLAGCAACAAEARELGVVTGRLEVMAPAQALPERVRLGALTAVGAAAASTNGHVAGHQFEDIPGSRSTLESGPRSAPLESPERGRAAVHGEAGRSPSRWRSPWPRRLALAGSLAAVAIAAVLVAGQPGSSTPANVEIDGQLTGASSAAVVVSMLDSGREVVLTSSEFPILPKGEAYEVWFVGTGDTPGDPNRISAGTFHPDPAGNTDVSLHAAVDPALYPVIEVTAEPTGGNPSVEGPVVAELDASDQFR